jgi:uncharacterized protein YbjT (DUF2867 family)
MTVLVTTPNGKVGSNVVKLLQEKGIPVRVAAHNVTKAQVAFPDAEVVAFDFFNRDTWSVALEGVTALYHAAPGDFPAEPQIELIEAAKKAGVKRVVRLSALGVEMGESPLRDVEWYLEQSSDLEYTILRPTWFMQNFTAQHNGTIRNGFLAEPAGDAKTAFIDTRDIAAVAVEALTEDGHHGKAYALTGRDLLTRYDVVDKLSAELGNPVTYIEQSDEEFRAGSQEYLSPVYLEMLSSLYGAVRAGYAATQTDTVQTLLGREPIDFETFVADHKAAWQ